MELALPICRDPSRWAGCRLVERVVPGGSEGWAGQVLLLPVVPEPILARLVAADDRVASGLGVRGRVLVGRVVTAPDVAAPGAPAKVQPPATGGEALHATVPAGRDVRIDLRLEVSHLAPGTSNVFTTNDIDRSAGSRPSAETCSEELHFGVSHRLVPHSLGLRVASCSRRCGRVSPTGGSTGERPSSSRSPALRRGRPCRWLHPESPERGPEWIFCRSSYLLTETDQIS
jgi:hypothetical protein